MNRASELMDELKEKLELKSDYALAKYLEIRQARISAYRANREKPDFYICVKAGTILNKDPVRIQIELELEKEKNEARRVFWNDFLSRSTAAVLVMTLSFCITFLEDVSDAEANNNGDNIISHYTKDMILHKLRELYHKIIEIFKQTPAFLIYS